TVLKPHIPPSSVLVTWLIRKCSLLSWTVASYGQYQWSGSCLCSKSVFADCGPWSFNAEKQSKHSPCCTMAAFRTKKEVVASRLRFALPFPNQESPNDQKISPFGSKVEYAASAPVNPSKRVK